MSSINLYYFSLIIYFSISLETDLSKLIAAKTEDFREKEKKEREKISTDMRALIAEKCVNDEYKQLNEVKSALMNHSRFVADVFDQKKNPKYVWKVENQAVLSKVLSKAGSLSQKVSQLETFLARRSGPCDHLKVEALKAEMKKISQKVGGFVMQNLKIVNFLPRRIEALERNLRELEDEWVERKKVEEIC